MSRFQRDASLRPFPPIGVKKDGPESDRLLQFPPRVQIELTSDQRLSLQRLADGLPHGSDSELISEVLSRGLEVMQQNLVKHQKVASRPSVSQFALDLAREQSPPHRHVEQYLAFWMTERLRNKFQQYLDEHPKISEEDAAAFLLDQGLFRVEEMVTKLDDLYDDMSNSEPSKDSRAAARQRLYGRIAKLRAIAAAVR